MFHRLLKREPVFLSRKGFACEDRQTDSPLIDITGVASEAPTI